MTQGELKVARWARFFAQYNIDRDANAAAERFVELLGQQSALLPHAEAVVREIAAVRPVIILTNGITAVQKSRMSRSPIAPLIAGMIISQEVGISKPRPEIFELALGQLGMAKDEVLMIGDGIASDVIGANNAGIDICWFNPHGKTLPPGVHAEYEIADIRDCVDIALMA